MGCFLDDGERAWELYAAEEPERRSEESYTWRDWRTSTATSRKSLQTEKKREEAREGKTREACKMHLSLQLGLQFDDCQVKAEPGILLHLLFVISERDGGSCVMSTSGKAQGFFFFLSLSFLALLVLRRARPLRRRRRAAGEQARSLKSGEET